MRLMGQVGELVAVILAAFARDHRRHSDARKPTRSRRCWKLGMPSRRLLHIGIAPEGYCRDRPVHERCQSANRRLLEDRHKSQAGGGFRDDADRDFDCRNS
jgi:hypothetical protein